MNRMKVKLEHKANCLITKDQSTIDLENGTIENSLF